MAAQGTSWLACQSQNLATAGAFAEQKPPFEGGGIHAAEACSAVEAKGSVGDVIFGELDGHKGRGVGALREILDRASGEEGVEDGASFVGQRTVGRKCDGLLPFSETAHPWTMRVWNLDRR